MKQLLVELVTHNYMLMSVFVFIFTAIKAIVSPALRAFKSIIVSFLVGLPVGILAGLIAIEWGVGEKTSIAVACIACLLSDKIVLSILSVDVQKLLTKWIKKRL